MALIPPDAAIRLRMQTEANLTASPVAPLKGLPSDLPDLRPGQTFTAKIQQPLPENTYRALVAGKEITLSLPESVKTGDTLELVVVDRTQRMIVAQVGSQANTAALRPGQTFTAQIQQLLPDNTYRALVAGKEITLSLPPESVKTGETVELVVVDRTPRMIVAQLAVPPNAAAGEDAAATGKNTQISPAGQMIGKLLLPAGQEPEPVLLNQGAPLLSAPLSATSAMAAALAPRLEQAATQSGLFYEAHQAQWLGGQRSTDALREEPQARHAAIDATKAEIAAKAGMIQPPAPAADERGSAATQSTITAGAEQAPAATAKDLLQSIPAELRPLVQQQLDAASTQRLIWQGEVWPGQTMQWQVSREARQQTGTQVYQDEQWNTSLALTTPRLGRIEATLGIAGNTVHIALTASSPESMSKLNARLPALKSSLEAAGLKPVGLQVLDGNR